MWPTHKHWPRKSKAYEIHELTKMCLEDWLFQVLILALCLMCSPVGFWPTILYTYLMKSFGIDPCVCRLTYEHTPSRRGNTAGPHAPKSIKIYYVWIATYAHKLAKPDRADRDVWGRQRKNYCKEGFQLVNINDINFYLLWRRLFFLLLYVWSACSIYGADVGQRSN